MTDDQKQKKTGLKDKLVLEMIAYWINVLYLTTIFAVFTSYKRLILANYQISYSNWGISLIKALVLAKVIMIGGLFLFSLDNKPLILPTLFKTFVFIVGSALCCCGVRHTRISARERIEWSIGSPFERRHA